VSEKEVVDGMVDSIVTPLRNFSNLPGIRRLAYIPLSGLLKQKTEPKSSLSTESLK
jgi:hypothetical protein